MKTLFAVLFFLGMPKVGFGQTTELNEYPLEKAWKFKSVEGDSAHLYSHFASQQLLIWPDGSFGTFLTAENEVTIKCCWKKSGQKLIFKEGYSPFHILQWNSKEILLQDIERPSIRLRLIK
jgi:hypothetical protein